MRAANVQRSRCPAALTMAGLAMVMLLPRAARAGLRDEWRDKMLPITPQGYVCRYTPKPISIDGNLDEAGWASAPWTSDFVNILGAGEPKPEHRTRCKLLYDDHFLYLAAELEESHLWATESTDRLYTENAFEVFLDPIFRGDEYWCQLFSHL